MKVSLRLPDELHQQLVILSGKQQAETGKIVAISDIIRGFIEAGLGDGVQEDAKPEVADAPRNIKVQSDTEEKNTKGQPRKPGRAGIKDDPEKLALFLSMQADGASVKEMMAALNASQAAVCRWRKAYKLGELGAE